MSTNIETYSTPLAISRTLARRSADTRVIYLTKDKKSWVIYSPTFLCSNPVWYGEMWSAHPRILTQINIAGRCVNLPRFVQAFGRDYAFSGQVAKGARVDSNPTVCNLVRAISSIMVASGSDLVYDSCLVNWYNPDHYIGPHSDAVVDLVPLSPIFSLTWGCLRTFRLTPRNGQHARAVSKSLKLKLNDGDMLVMGGECQSTHVHELLREKDISGTRINFTFRCFEKEA